MAGYAWFPKFRINSADGPPVVVDLRNDLLVAPGAGPSQIEIELELDQEPFKNVNKQLKPLTSGVRPVVKFSAVDAGEMGDSLVILQILNALINPSATVDLSMDDGQVWRQVVLTEKPVFTPNAGKPAAGCTWKFVVSAVDLITEILPPGSL
jgi:hypothetical protein